MTTPSEKAPGARVAAAAGLGRLLPGVLFGVRPADPVTYASTAVVLTLVGAEARK